MHHVYMADEIERQGFAQRAAAHFATVPGHWTYSDDPVGAGVWFAVRWGLGNDCVLVFRVGDAEPVIYGELITAARPA